VRAALLLACALGACQAPLEAPAGRDLLTPLDDVEVLSNNLDLPFLVARRALESRAWRPPQGPSVAPVLWNAAPSASLDLPLASPEASELRLRLRRHAGASPLLSLAVLLNGRLLGKVRPRVSESEFSFRVPASAVIPGANRLILAASSRRKRGRLFALSGLELHPAQGTGERGPPRLDANGVVLPAGASLGVFFEQQRGAEIRADLETPDAGQGHARVVLETDAGRTELADARVAGGRMPLRLRPALVDQAYARLEVTNVGPVALRLRRLGLTTRPAIPTPGIALATRPNVVLFLTDTLRADHLGAYGHAAPTSPRFDAFAREAILFEQAWAQSGWTKPAVASLFTGLTPGAHRLEAFTAILPAPIRPLARIFRDAGFRTAGFSGNPILNRRSGFNRGFRTWRDAYENGAEAASLVSSALGWLDAEQGPFLLYLHTFEPHWDYRPGEEHWRPFRPKGPQPYPLAVALDKALGDPTAMRWLRSAYEGEIHKNDAAFGALLDGLRERGLLDSSVVVFLADHGDEFQDHGGLGHATTLYQEELHIPLAIRLPGAARGGARDPQPIQQIDLLPTLLRLANLPAEPGVEGRDLSARVVKGAADAAPAEMLSEIHLLLPRKAALRVGALKLIENDDLGRDPRTGSVSELYDLAADPHETVNLAGARPITAAYLRQRMAALRRAQVLRGISAESASPPVSAQEREQLRALGYVQ
jgi:arylsulfatase A-like enzyme